MPSNAAHSSPQVWHEARRRKFRAGLQSRHLITYAGLFTSLAAADDSIFQDPDEEIATVGTWWET
jgi:hypothetical protein